MRIRLSVEGDCTHRFKKARMKIGNWDTRFSYVPRLRHTFIFYFYFILHPGSSLAGITKGFTLD